MVSHIEQIDELAYVEQELEDLQNLIKQHFSAVDDLSHIQKQLRALDQHQETIETTSRKADITRERLEKAQGSLNDRADALEARIQQLTHECSQLKQIMEQTLVRCAEEWTQQQQSMQAYLNDFETRIQKDVQYALNRVNGAGAASSTQKERLEKLDVRVRGLSNSVKKMGNTLKVWNGLAVALSAIGLLALAVMSLTIL